MTTTTLLLIVGCVVAAKTLAFVAFVVRRGRRQRVELDAAAVALKTAEAAAPQPGDPAGWRVQWSEPGVMLVENTSELDAAREVTLSATLTAGSGAVATIERAARFVGTGACFTARFADVDPWLTASSLSYSMDWLTPDGERRWETRTAQSVVPVADLTPELA